MLVVPLHATRKARDFDNLSSSGADSHLLDIYGSIGDHTSSAEDVSLNGAKNVTVLPLCCILPSTTGDGADLVGQSKRRAQLAGLQQLLACCFMVLATFNGHTLDGLFSTSYSKRVAVV